MSNKEKDLMGYDPLEWLKEDSASATPETTAEPMIEEPVAATEEVSSDPVLDLETSLQIMDVALLKPRLEESLNNLKEITLRADSDITVDGAGIQLLLAFVKQAETNGVKLQWESLPTPIAEAANLLNAKQILLSD